MCVFVYVCVCVCVCACAHIPHHTTPHHPIQASELEEAGIIPVLKTLEVPQHFNSPDQQQQPFAVVVVNTAEAGKRYRWV
jgi:hypothetical protein